MEYDFNQIADPARFQRLVNAILIARFGEDARLTPLRGPDGGSDGEARIQEPSLEFMRTASAALPDNPFIAPPRPGRYLFQAKYHRTSQQRLSDLRALVVREFESELRESVLERPDRGDVSYFFVITNLPASAGAKEKVENVGRKLLRSRRLHADIWWAEMVTAFLDRMPEIWLAYKEMFPGGVAPTTAQVMNDGAKQIHRTFKTAIAYQYRRDINVKFRQIELEQNLFDLFVDLDIELHVRMSKLPTQLGRSYELLRRTDMGHAPFDDLQTRNPPSTALNLMVDDVTSVKRILLEGGPGQGKSTITQMAVQIYRERLLGYARGARRHERSYRISKARLPFRIELGEFADWLAKNADGTMEQFMARMISQDSGQALVAVDDLQSVVERNPVILLLDGLDEIGNDSLRDRVVDAIMATVNRFEDALTVDLRVVLTTRPPALSGRRDRLEGFARAVLAPMAPRRIDDYLERWLSVQVRTPQERLRIRKSFESRRHDTHVDALARNPMQLSVLLQFIYLKGEAFPDRRAELYRDYFQIVIDRDVEKSPQLRSNRHLVEGLHSFLGFRFHGATEIDDGKGTLRRGAIIGLARRWLHAEGHPESVAERFFALGEERFGLIVAASGEGEDTTYGFEVQPIQEYFAASYISNHVAEGNAHEIFELLIRRSYWREVALFLAGLRRPNEKADLIARARAADDDESRPWRRNGRSIVLQLLREGVLHQPRHVLNEAVRFVGDLLDVRQLRLYGTGTSLTDAICEVGELYRPETLVEGAKRAAEAESDSSDEYALLMVHRVASRLVSDDDYGRLVLSYSGRDPGIRSLVRMTCAYGSGVLERLSSIACYWEGVPGHIWAQRLWRAAVEHGRVVELRLPEDVHSSLVTMFAMDYPDVDGPRRVVDIRAASPPAIWRLYQNLQAIRWKWGTAERGGSEGAGVTASDSALDSRQDEMEVSYEYLPTELECCVRDLVMTSDALLLSDLHELAEISEYEQYVGTIATHLKDSGVAGLVACRCAMELLQSWPSYSVLRMKRGLAENLMRGLVEFYDRRSGSLRNRSISWRFPSGVPASIRLRRGCVPVPLYEVIGDYLRGTLGGDEQDVLCVVQEMPLPRAVLKPLVETCDELRTVLRFVGDKTMVGFSGQRRLKVQDTRKILKICRDTDEQAVLGPSAKQMLHFVIS